MVLFLAVRFESRVLVMQETSVFCQNRTVMRTRYPGQPRVQTSQSINNHFSACPLYSWSLSHFLTKWAPSGGGCSLSNCGLNDCWGTFYKTGTVLLLSSSDPCNLYSSERMLCGQSHRDIDTVQHQGCLESYVYPWLCLMKPQIKQEKAGGRGDGDKGPKGALVVSVHPPLNVFGDSGFIAHDDLHVLSRAQEPHWMPATPV